VTQRTSPARQQMWDDVREQLDVAAEAGADCLFHVERGKAQAAAVDARYAAHHANRALDLLEQLTQ
jgi:hypothetical protein